VWIRDRSSSSFGTASNFGFDLFQRSPPSAEIKILLQQQYKRKCTKTQELKLINCLLYMHYHYHRCIEDLGIAVCCRCNDADHASDSTLTHLHLRCVRIKTANVKQTITDTSKPMHIKKKSSKLLNYYGQTQTPARSLQERKNRQTEGETEPTLVQYN